MNLYQALLEKWARDFGLSTAIGFQAGMRASFDPSNVSLEEKVSRALEGPLSGEPAPLPVTHPPTPSLAPPKRGPGRPRKEQNHEGGTD